MLRLLCLVLVLFCVVSSRGQTLKISGNVTDTVPSEALRDAVITAVRISDSVLVSYTRSNAAGYFEMLTLPVDTYEVVVQHPRFGDKTFLIVGSASFQDFPLGKFRLPDKSIDLREVVVYTTRDPVFFRGDTLVYVADSFKVKQNATVEDLLKKLPGIQVDKDGSIKSQGKEVSQVLVDGDEFFGTDPTMATKNLAASNIESVEVYEKKEEGTAGTNETVTVMDLKLKEDAKKGYFGRVSGGSDFRKFYEGEMLANRFSGKKKISVFGLLSNTPKSSFGYDDTYRYGIENDNMFTSDEGETFFFTHNEPTGFPLTRRAGIYFSDQLGGGLKANANYTFHESDLDAFRDTYTQFFATDTSYNIASEEVVHQVQKTHAVNFKLNQKVDSLTTIEWEVRSKKSESGLAHLTSNGFFAEDSVETRRTSIFNSGSTDALQFSSNLSLTRKFKKPDRALIFRHYLNLNNNESFSLLRTNDRFLLDTLRGDSIIDQEKDILQKELSNRFYLNYTEPLAPKWKLQASYDFTTGASENNREVLNSLNGEYVLPDPVQSNDFRNERNVHIASAGIIYETRKTRLGIHSRLRNTALLNRNLTLNSTLSQDFTNFLPLVNYSYRYTDNATIRFNYKTSSTAPTITQLQPIPDNTNPNFIRVGNPSLRPNYVHELSGNFYSYSPVKGHHWYAGISFNSLHNDFSSSVTYDELGRTFTKPVNVSGNYMFFFYVGGEKKILSRILGLEPRLSVSSNRTRNFVNEVENLTLRKNYLGGLHINLENDLLECSFGADLTYTKPSTTLNPGSAQPYGTQQYEFSAESEAIPHFYLSTSLNFTKNTRRSNGYNLDYLIWNASVERRFLEKENLILGISSYDLLNQNISNTRTVEVNRIVDTRSQVIGRYILVRLTYKFDSNKENLQDESMF